MTYHLTAEREQELLKLLREGNSLTVAAIRMNISYWTILKHRATSPRFNTAVVEAMHVAVRRVADVLGNC